MGYLLLYAKCQAHICDALGPILPAEIMLSMAALSVDF